MALLLFLFCSFCVLAQGEQRKFYSGYQVLRSSPSSPSHHTLLDMLSSSVEVLKAGNNTVDLLVAPDKVDLVTQMLSCSQVPFTVTSNDLQADIEEESEESDKVVEVGRPLAGCTANSGMSWTRYHDLKTLDGYVDCLGSSYTSHAQLHYIGTTSEGRTMRVVRVGRGTRSSSRPAVWIDGGIHAREWVSPATVSMILRELVENYDNNRDIVDNMDVYILVVANPDGYEYSRKKDRMWRKTRSGSGSCIGVDPNRNWGYQWGGQGASRDPCRETYRGPYAFSEPETRAIRDFILARKDNIKMYLTFHSYGQYFLYPWGYDRVYTDDQEELHRMASIGVAATGEQYSIGSAAGLLYPAAGGSDDWAKGGAKIKYSYTVELPDKGRHGFILPAKHIKKVGYQTFQGVRAMLLEVIKGK